MLSAHGSQPCNWPPTFGITPLGLNFANNAGVCITECLIGVGPPPRRAPRHESRNAPGAAHPPPRFPAFSRPWWRRPARRTASRARACSSWPTDYLGLLSGGCLEADLKRFTPRSVGRGIPRAIEYDMRGPDDILFGICGCEGGDARANWSLQVPEVPRRCARGCRARRLRAGRPTSAGFGSRIRRRSARHYDAAHRCPPWLSHAAARSLDEGTSRAMNWEEGGRRTRAFVPIPRTAPACIDLRGGPRLRSRW